MSGALRLGGAALVLLLAQALAVSALPGAVRPDLMLVFALALGLRGGGSGPLILAFGAGFALDALSNAPLGLFALLRGTACALTRVLDRALYLRSPGPWTVYVTAYTLADAVLMGLCLHWLAPEAAVPWSTLALRAPGVVIATAITAAPLLLLLRRLDIEGSARPTWALGARDSRSRP